MRLVEGVERDGSLSIEIDGRKVHCFAGEVIATVLVLEQDATALRGEDRRARAVFCNMGVCCECMVWVETQARTWRCVRACLTEVREGQRVRTIGDGDV